MESGEDALWLDGGNAAVLDLPVRLVSGCLGGHRVQWGKQSAGEHSSTAPRPLSLFPSPMLRFDHAEIRVRLCELSLPCVSISLSDSRALCRASSRFAGSRREVLSLHVAMRRTGNTDSLRAPQSRSRRTSMSRPLSVELVERILADDVLDQADLAACCLVSRSVFAVVQPRL